MITILLSPSAQLGFSWDICIEKWPHMIGPVSVALRATSSFLPMSALVQKFTGLPDLFFHQLHGLLHKLPLAD